MKTTVRRLKLLIKEEASKPEGTINIPPDHKAGMKVPKGGSMCANCKGLADDEEHCQNENYQTWHGSVGAEEPTLIPEPVDQYCCDWYSPSRRSR